MSHNRLRIYKIGIQLFKLYLKVVNRMPQYWIENKQKKSSQIDSIHSVLLTKPMKDFSISCS